MTKYYEILEVSREATVEEIKTAYRRLALRFHPDMNPRDKVAEEQFKRITEAYQILSDLEKRQLYDLYGDAGLAGLDVGGFDDIQDIFNSFGEAFEGFFNSGASRVRADQPQAGADLRQRVVLTLEEAIRGLNTSLSVERRVPCRRCQGRGAEAGSRLQTCFRCQGMGEVSLTAAFPQITHPCPDCQGTGTIHLSPCRACQGAGLIKEKKKIQVRIPPGVDAGSRLRLRGEGEAGTHGAPPGDLYLEIAIAPHPVFTPKGRDLYCRAQISFVAAALGTEVEVPTLTASTRLVIPAGTQPGATFRLPGLGLPGLRGKTPGDLVVVVDLQTPTQLSPRQKQLLREFLNSVDAGEAQGHQGVAGSRVGAANNKDR